MIQAKLNIENTINDSVKPRPDFEELEYKASELTYNKLGELLKDSLGVHYINEDVLKSLELINHEKGTNTFAF